MLVYLSLNLLFFFELQLAQSLLVMCDLGFTLANGLKHFLVILLFLSCLQRFAFCDGFPDHLFFTLRLLVN